MHILIAKEILTAARNWVWTEVPSFSLICIACSVLTKDFSSPDPAERKKGSRGGSLGDCSHPLSGADSAERLGRLLGT